jgi:dihydrofolate synthase/folylpolyglutamate synthase
VGIALKDYRGALDYLFARTTGESRLGLERTNALLAVLGAPHERLRSFHVAGTNGKGSVTATIDALLHRRGLRVARYTSPHLVDFRERLLIDGAPVDADAIVAFIERWTPEIERIGATFFEATTAMAFQLFADADVDVAVIETGLGGRLDATNVITPLVAGVTTIGVDHTEYLGTTIAEIAREKAGIFKSGVPAVIGEPDKGTVELLSGHARSAGAHPILTVARSMPISHVRLSSRGTSFNLVRFHPDEPVEMHTPLIGHHQASNAATAIAMLDAAGPAFHLADAEVVQALHNVSLPGRFQRVGLYIFDVAHNPDGATVLAATLQSLQPDGPLVAVLTVLSDKDWRGILMALAPVIDHFILSVAPTAPASRLWDPHAAGRYASAAGLSAEVIVDFDAALDAATRTAATVIITGSFHTVGDAMSRLQVSPLAG